MVRRNQRRLRVATTSIAMENLMRSEFQPMRSFGQANTRLYAAVRISEKAAALSRLVSPAITRPRMSMKPIA